MLTVGPMKGVWNARMMCLPSFTQNVACPVIHGQDNTTLRAATSSGHIPDTVYSCAMMVRRQVPGGAGLAGRGHGHGLRGVPARKPHLQVRPLCERISLLKLQARFHTGPSWVMHVHPAHMQRRLFC